MLYGSDIGPMDQRLCQRTCQDEFGLQHQDQERILDFGHYLPRWDEITPSRQVFHLQCPHSLSLNCQYVLMQLRWVLIKSVGADFDFWSNTGKIALTKPL